MPRDWNIYLGTAIHPRNTNKYITRVTHRPEYLFKFLTSLDVSNSRALRDLLPLFHLYRLWHVGKKSQSSDHSYLCPSIKRSIGNSMNHNVYSVLSVNPVAIHYKPISGPYLDSRGGHPRIPTTSTPASGPLLSSRDMPFRLATIHHHQTTGLCGCCKTNTDGAWLGLLGDLWPIWYQTSHRHSQYP